MPSLDVSSYTIVAAQTHAAFVSARSSFRPAFAVDEGMRSTFAVGGAGKAVPGHFAKMHQEDHPRQLYLC